MIDFSNGSVYKLKATNADSIEREIASLLLFGEQVRIHWCL